MSPPDFCFGAMSPYSWFAAERIGAAIPQARWRPLFAGGLFAAAGRSSWGLDDRRAAGQADCEARAVAHGLGPIHWPDPWPTSDVRIARAMLVIGEREPMGAGAPGADTPGPDASSPLARLALTAMRMAFREGVDLAEPDAVAEAARRCELDAGELLAAIELPRIKAALREAVDRAVAAGVFGVPTVVVDGALFWGDDRLGDAARAAHP